MLVGDYYCIRHSAGAYLRQQLLRLESNLNNVLVSNERWMTSESFGGLVRMRWF